MVLYKWFYIWFQMWHLTSVLAAGIWIARRMMSHSDIRSCSDCFEKRFMTQSHLLLIIHYCNNIYKTTKFTHTHKKLPPEQVKLGCTEKWECFENRKIKKIKWLNFMVWCKYYPIIMKNSREPYTNITEFTVLMDPSHLKWLCVY